VLDVCRHLKVSGFAIRVLDPHIDHPIAAAVVLDIDTLSSQSRHDAAGGEFQVPYWATLGPSTLVRPSQVEWVTWPEIGFRR
jgi:hypothetical protein